MFLDKAIFQRVSVATLLTYKHNNILLEGRSIKMANTLAKKAGIADTVSILKLLSTRLKQTFQLKKKIWRQLVKVVVYLDEHKNKEYPKAVPLKNAVDCKIPSSVFFKSSFVGILPFINSVNCKLKNNF